MNKIIIIIFIISFITALFLALTGKKYVDNEHQLKKSDRKFDKRKKY